MNKLIPLSRSFYERDVVSVAKDILGHFLVRKIDSSTIVVGKIVEVEAYNGKDDPASHAYKGVTPKNKIIFGKPGIAYVYMIYGMYYCLNVITEPEGIPGSVFFRAVEPLQGIKYMMQRRKTDNLLKLTNGPGKLTIAFNITEKLNGTDMTKSGPLFIAKNKDKNFFEIISTPRIGIRVGLEYNWRFYIRDNAFVSKKK